MYIYIAPFNNTPRATQNRDEMEWSSTADEIDAELQLKTNNLRQCLETGEYIINKWVFTSSDLPFAMLQFFSKLPNVYVSMHVYIHTYMYIYACIHICVCVFVYVNISIVPSQYLLKAFHPNPIPLSLFLNEAPMSKLMASEFTHC